MIGRLEVQNELLYIKLFALNIPLPKLQSKEISAKTKKYAMPSDDDIFQILERAKRAAIDDAINFGMHCNACDIHTIEIPIARLNINIGSDYDETDDDDDHNSQFTCNFQEEDIDPNIEPSTKDLIVNNGKGYTTITDHNGEEKLVRKSTIVWLMSD